MIRAGGAYKLSFRQHSEQAMWDLCNEKAIDTIESSLKHGESKQDGVGTSPPPSSLPPISPVRPHADDGHTEPPRSAPPA